MRRFALALCTILVLAACGPKKVQVKIPVPVVTPSGDLDGIASYYAEPYNGRKTANGETFDSYQALTAAHRTLPFNTVVHVVNKQNGRSVDVRINDRGPFVKGRVIDLSLRAAREIDMVRAGVAPVKLTIIKPEDLNQPIYAVQVGAFESSATAEHLKQQLEKKYDTVSIQAFSGEKTLYRVRIGSEPNIQSAQKLASKIRDKDLQPFVVRVN